jgi:hypothetical protein
MNGTPTRRITVTFAVAAALSLVGACSKENKPVDTTAAASATATPPAASAISVVDIDMGRHIAPDKKISDKTDDFAPGDTIYGSLHTTGSAANSTFVGKWTFEDGSTVDENTQTLSPNGDNYTEFHISKPTGFPKGKYTLHVSIDGKEVRTKDVTVK